MYLMSFCLVFFSIVRVSSGTEQQKPRKENKKMTEIHSKQKGTAERGSNIDELRCKIHLSVRPYLESNNREDQTFGFFPSDDLCLLIHVMFPLRFGDLFCHDGKKQRGFQVAPDCECEQ